MVDRGKRSATLFLLVQLYKQLLMNRSSVSLMTWHGACAAGLVRQIASRKAMSAMRRLHASRSPVCLWRVCAASSSASGVGSSAPGPEVREISRQCHFKARLTRYCTRCHRFMLLRSLLSLTLISFVAANTAFTCQGQPCLETVLAAVMSAPNTCLMCMGAQVACVWRRL